uniref:Uncharacterized protein n=1 Tax=Cucumis sativus TaxID=3659 RepID=A0A0A0KLS2_CUCSA
MVACNDYKFYLYQHFLHAVEFHSKETPNPTIVLFKNICLSPFPLLGGRGALLSHITTGDDVLVLGALSVLATLLQTKELDELMLDALGILPQRKQHKKLLLVLSLDTLYCNFGLCFNRLHVLVLSSSSFSD